MPEDTTDLPWVVKDGDPTWLGGDRWKIRVYAGLDPTGKQRQRSSNFRADGIAEARTKARHARVSLENEIEAAAQWKGTVKELVGEWQAAKASEWAETTRYANAVMCRRIVRELGKIRLEALKARDLDRFYASLLAAGLSASTANHYHRLIHAMLQQAYKWESVPGNVADRATPPTKRHDGTHAMPTPTALAALIDSCPPSLRMAAYLASTTGCRRGEIVGLCWDDIDGRRLTVRRALVQVPGGKLTAKSPKSGKARTISLDDDTLQALAAHREWLANQCVKRGGRLADNGPILAKVAADANGRQPYPPGWITQEWTKRCLAVGVDFRFHSLRHFHATELINGMVPITTVSGRLGHSKISTTTDFYAHALKPSDDHAANVIGDIMRRG